MKPLAALKISHLKYMRLFIRLKTSLVSLQGVSRKVFFQFRLIGSGNHPGKFIYTSVGVNTIYSVLLFFPIF